LWPDRRNNPFGRRWRGEVPLRRLFWRDMAALGTLINLVASLAALMLASQGAPAALAVALHFAPVPYNLFLAMAVWRSPQRTAWLSGAGLLWVLAMTVL